MRNRSRRKRLPTFLVHADDDQLVPPENSIYFYLTLRKVKVSTEMHIYEIGGHGFGSGKGKDACSSWMPRYVDWIKGLGLLDKK